MDVGLVSKFVFPAPSPTYTEDDFDGKLLWIPMAGGGDKPASVDGAPAAVPSFPCAFFECNCTARYIVLYFHRNAEDLGNCVDFCEGLRDHLQVHVLAVEYPGYGPQPAMAASVDQAIRQAETAFRFVRDTLNWPADSILVIGCSVGASVALALAMREMIGGLVLVAPFLSLRDICRVRFGNIADYITEQFPNELRVRLLTCATLLVHGKHDSVVPHSHAEKLYQRMRCKKALVSPPELEHNTHLLKNERFLLIPMLKFFGLPDYCFEHVQVPDWARRRPGPIPTCDPLHLLERLQNATQGAKAGQSNDDDDLSLEASEVDPVDFLAPPPSDEDTFPLVPRTPQVRMAGLLSPADYGSTHEVLVECVTGCLGCDKNQRK